MRTLTRSWKSGGGMVNRGTANHALTGYDAKTTLCGIKITRGVEAHSFLMLPRNVTWNIDCRLCVKRLPAELVQEAAAYEAKRLALLRAQEVKEGN